MIILIESNKEATDPKVSSDEAGKFHGLHYDLIKRYGVSVSQITTDISLPHL